MGLGFNRGWNEVKRKDDKAIRDALYDALNIRSKSNLHAYRLGKRDMKSEIKDSVKKVFLKFGIDDPFGQE